MPRLHVLSFLLCSFLIFNCSSDDSNSSGIPIDNTPDPELMYYPPNDGSETWETASVSELEWNSDELQPLLDFLEDKNTKSFMILHNGKIVVESYMNSHNATSPWYWASAGKTLTTTVTGIAQDEGLLDINDRVSDYLGTNLSLIHI